MLRHLVEHIENVGKCVSMMPWFTSPSSKVSQLRSWAWTFGSQEAPPEQSMLDMEGRRCSGKSWRRPLKPVCFMLTALSRTDWWGEFWGFNSFGHPFFLRRTSASERPKAPPPRPRPAKFPILDVNLKAHVQVIQDLTRLVTRLAPARKWHNYQLMSMRCCTTAAASGFGWCQKWRWSSRGRWLLVTRSCSTKGPLTKA